MRRWQDSTRREGSSIICNAASVSVIECASVNAVTTHNTSVKATRNERTPFQ